MKAPVIARLRLPDGREFDYHSECEEQYLDSQEFWWTEGNAGCDCNRSLFLNKEYQLGLGANNDPESESTDCLPCGDTIQLVSLTINNKLVPL